jgi:hypothetical protein
MREFALPHESSQRYNLPPKEKYTMRRFRTILFTVLAFCVAAVASSLLSASGNPSNGKATILKASDITTSIFPERVFYQGKTVPTELRNTGGVHFADGAYFLAGLVDSSGYSTAVRNKYQAYMLTEVPLQFGGHELEPGAYGAGFVSGSFVVTDLGAHDLFRVPAAHDTVIKRPVPLQVLPGSVVGTYRLYRGRDYVEFRRRE